MMLDKRKAIMIIIRKKRQAKRGERVGVRGKTYVYVKEEACALDNNILKIELNC